MSKKMQDLIREAHGLLRHQPIERRVRAKLGADTIVDSTRAMLLWEPRRVCPSYAVPAEDIEGELAAAPATNGHADGVLHPGIPFAVHTADGEPVTVGERVGAGFRLADEDVAGYVALDFDAFEWLEEDEQILGHPRDPFHRVDVLESARPVRIEIGGDVVAETTSARMAFETQLHTRFYLPREDVRVELEPSSKRTYCPYKGEASYWSVEAGGGVRDGIAWTYAEPLPDAAKLAGLVAFWDEVVDVYVDDELRERPRGPIADAMRDEFGLA
jgi:uncharacterized protein (DUF427 family)